MARLIRWCLPALLLLLAAGPVHANGDGQDDLDKATEAKLSAESSKDLDEVIRLSESALKKGLDQANTDFAKKLLSSTLIQRASEMTKRILLNLTSFDDPRYHQRRQAILADLARAVQLDPKQPQVFLLIAQLNLPILPEGDAKLAREALDKALELGIEEAPARAKALMLRGSLQEQPEKKLADYDEAVRLVPRDATTVRTRGLALADMGKLDAALADLEKAIQLEPNDGPTYEAKAIVLARLKKYDEALAALEKARQLSPNSVEPLRIQAGVHAQQEKLDTALEDLNQALTLEPNDIRVLLLRAGVYQEKGEEEKALDDVDQVLKLKPNLPLALRTRALYLSEGKRFAEAIEALEKLRKVQPKDVLTLLQLSMLYGVENKADQAIEAYSAVLAEKPDEWRALHGRADIYLNVGKQAEAIADYEKAVPGCKAAIKLHPDDETLLKSLPSLLNNFAWVLATSPDDKLRDGKRAIPLATEACELTEYKLAYILSTLAATYAETGDFDTAIKWSSKAVEIGDPQHDEALKKELESYKAKKPWRELLPEAKPAENEDKPKENP